jgi:cysteinyl-tRNA synthetase
LIRRLIEKGHAYVVDGDVYYDISTFPGYGKLSGRNIEQMQAGARVDVDNRKKNPLDFALWKASKPGEPRWNSPWGEGRPGWHIECSVMAMKYSGDTLDIHAGGQDLIFPHHENEIAQSEGATGKPFAKYWLHNGFLDIEGEKMSKSLGNFLTVHDIVKKYNPIAIRVFFLLKHYRSPIDFSEERIKEAQAALNRLRNAYRKMLLTLEKYKHSQLISQLSGKSEEAHSQILINKELLIEALDDDFNTARAMGNLFEIAKIVNSCDEDSPGIFEAFQTAKEVFDTIGTKVFGLTFEPESVGSLLINDLMDMILEIRSIARKEKNWALSDMIRDRLKKSGVILEDRPDGTLWKLE